MDSIEVIDLGTFDYVIVGAGSAGCVLASFCRETHNLLMHQDVRRIQGSRIVAGSGFSEGRRVRPLFGNSG